MALLKPRFPALDPTIADLEKLIGDTKKDANRALNDLKKSGREIKKAVDDSLNELRRRSLNALDSAGEEQNKQLALSHARSISYVMTGKSGGQLLLREVNDWMAEMRGGKNHKAQRVQSILGGAFLRMYLDHEVEPDTIAQVRDEVQVSPEFKAIQAEMQGWLTLQCARFAKLKTSEEKIRKEIASIALRNLRAKMERSGIAFRYELNPVLGGVSKVDIGEVAIATAIEERGTKIDYRIGVVFFDTYDFDNARTGEYDAYRKKLAQLLRQGKYGEFWKAYEREVSGALGIDETGRKTHLDQAAVFASYMYALEKKGWTPGPLPWDVTVPMVGSFVVPAESTKRR